MGITDRYTSPSLDPESERVEKMVDIIVANTERYRASMRREVSNTGYELVTLQRMGTEGLDETTENLEELWRDDLVSRALEDPRVRDLGLTFSSDPKGPIDMPDRLGNPHKVSVSVLVSDGGEMAVGKEVFRRKDGDEKLHAIEWRASWPAANYDARINIPFNKADISIDVLNVS